MRSTLIFSIFLLFCAFLGSLSSPAAAIEVADLKFIEFSSDEGLSSNAVLDIAEDDKGYIWLATMNGLNRYSGYEIKQYHPSDTNDNALPGGFIQELFIDSQGRLWVGTDSGLALYQPETDDFLVFNQENSVMKSDSVTAISESIGGDILFSDNKYLYRLNRESLEVTVLTKVFEQNTIVKAIFDEPNRTWIGSNTSGAKIYDKTVDKVYSLNGVNPFGVVIDDIAFHDIKVINGNYWIATSDGVKVVNASGDIIFELDEEILGSNGKLNVLSIESVGSDTWLATDLGLFVVKNTSNNDFSFTDVRSIHLKNELFNITGLKEKIFIKILKDDKDGVWLGSLQGAYKFHPSYAQIRFQPIYSSDDKSELATIWGLDKTTNGEIFFVSQRDGVGAINTETSTIESLAIPSLPQNGLSYWYLVIDNENNFWVATSSGLFAFEKNGNTLKVKSHLFEGHFVDVLYFSGDKIWAWISEQGLVSIDVNTVFTSLSDAIEVHNISTNSNSLVPIYTDSLQRVWLRSQTGALIYNPNSRKVSHILDNVKGINSPIYGVYDKDGYYWVTARSEGVLKLDKESLEVIAKQGRDSQSGLIFSSIATDDSIWYVDAVGIHEIKVPSLNEATTISKSQLAFNSLGENSVLVDNNGDLLFGGDKGINKIMSSAMEPHISNNRETPKPQISEFEIFGEETSISNTADINGKTSNISYETSKKLNYDESRFSVSFALVNAAFPHEVTYRYKLTGYDDVWIYNKNSRIAQFNNVSFGLYNFEVQAREPSKSWSQSQVLNIEIARPPWLHSVALIFYGLMAVVLLAFILRQYQIRKANQLAIRESEERLKLTLWSSGDELWDWDVYRGQVYRANTWGTLDFPQDDIRTSGAFDANIHPNDINRVKEVLREHLEGKSDFYELAYRAKTFKNQWIWILDRGKVVERDHNNQPVRMTGTLKNINHLKEAEEQLNLFKRSIENISEGVFITNTQFKFISVNHAYCTYTGETREQALASYMHFHLYPDAFTEEIKKTLKTKGNWSGEVESVRVNGERYEMELNIDAVHDEDGKISHFVGVFSDITSRKSTEKELLKLANTDPLTELPNRSFFQASHQNLVRKGVQHTLLCLDMDNFKKINDSLGHQTGDILIKQIAKRLQRITGKNATCYRLGGDEFSILMEDSADIHTVTHYTQSLLDTLSRPFIINKQEFVLGASIGIAFYPDDGTSPQEMLKNADTAMYFAKNNGGNSYQFFSGEMNQNAVRQLQIENLIRQGIKDDLFTVYYQPKVDIASGKLVSMEALVRFEHPQKGIVSPGQFIPLAEQTGQIIEIGEQVLRKACADTKRWVNQGLFSGRVAVNISAKQFELPDLDERINKILSEVGLSPLHLECEITEGTLMESPENGLRMMSRLRERGIHLALDDFGTGYSSLAYLKRFPLNTLKIDKAFIDDIAKSNVDRHMAAAIINIAHNLGLKVVAEGVEEEAQLNILRRYDCEMLQGFLYSRPLNAERFEKLLSENQKLHTLLGQSNF